MLIHSINPANGTVLRSYPTLTKKALTTKLKAAHEASWRFRHTTVESRAMWLKKLAGILEHEMEDLATLLTNETGRTILTSRQEILECAACCRYFAGHAEQLPADSKVPMELSSCEICWQPLGVVLAIMQAESPFWQVFRFLAPALLAGDTVLLRHASAVCQSAMEIELLLMRAGFPRDVVQTLLISERQLGPLLSEKQITAVAVGEHVLSGRAMVGRAKGLLRTTAQERSSNPFLVMPSANLYAAIRAGVEACCAANGAANAGTARFVVHEAIYEDFELLFVAEMEEVKIGNPAKDDTALGPLANAGVVAELEGQVAAAVRDGGRLLTGGQRMVGVGNYFEPTVIAGIAPGKKTRRTVFSGPVAMLFKVASVDEAIEVANEMPHSLGASVWTEKAEEQQDFSAQLECESVFINSGIVGDPLMALIGDRAAGGGDELAAAMLREMMMARTIVTAEAAPNAEMDLEFPHEEEAGDVSAYGFDYLPGSVTGSVTAKVDEKVASFADVLSAAEEDSYVGLLTESLMDRSVKMEAVEMEVVEQEPVQAVAQEAIVAGSVADLFDAEEDWTPTVTLRAAYETAKVDMAEAPVVSGKEMIAEVDETEVLPVSVTAEEAVSMVKPELELVAPAQKAMTGKRETGQQESPRKTLMSGMMKHIVDQVLAKKTKSKPAIAKMSATEMVTDAIVQKPAVKSKAKRADAATKKAAEPELYLVSADVIQPQKPVDLKSMFEKALSGRPAA